MITASTTDNKLYDPATWKAIIAEYRQPNTWLATWQLFNTLGSYALVWVMYYYSLSISWWLVPPLCVLAGGLLVRVFIIFHDCGHGSFFASRFANDFWGCICAVLTFTPYYHWRGEHAIHHGTTGHLDKRGTGDVWTMTVTEYLTSSRWRRFSYRLVRNPVILFVVSPLMLFLIVQRFPDPKAEARERHSVWWMNAALLLVGVAMSLAIGIVPYLVFQLGALAVAASAGVWLFYVQHQFEDAYWERGEDWDYAQASLKGSSYFKLPRVLQWFSGNIGFHHIHHLSARIPNYNLERCHRSDPMFHDIKPITLIGSLKTLSLRLWDESSKKLVGFRHLKKIRPHRDSRG
jgi:acyl-lipid omega-6 desaturase (Delta-12 desaturase)